MKPFLIAAASALTLTAVFLCEPARAQLSNRITRDLIDPAPIGRDYWLAFPSNNWGEDLGGKYMRIYITSQKNTTAYVVSQGQATTLPVEAYKVASFKAPEFWEMESSGIVENKAIHVYSNDADLSVCFFSHDDYSSDGSAAIPTIGWGTDYVVAASGSLLEGPVGNTYDDPSECVIVADEDGTVVSITPSCNCRQNTTGNGMGDSVVVFPAGQKFNVTLNRGESMQLMPVLATDTIHFDMTGTIIHANHPIGVIGGAMETNIPASYPYAGFVFEMIPPISRWGETYYTSSFAEPPNSPGHDYTRYLFISSQPNQTIMRHNCTDSDRVECTIPNQYGISWDELALGQKFWSNAPFLVVSYMNSSTYPNRVNGDGGPSECTVLPREQFSDTVVFETPLSIGNIVPYYNYANIIYNVKDAKNITFDGGGIDGHPKQCIDSNWDIITISGIAPGEHTIFGSDSGVGVYFYGYGYDESYAWSAPGNFPAVRSQDTVSPMADTMTQCNREFVHVTDSGLESGGIKQSGLLDIQLDSAYNMTFQPDSNFIPGSGADTSGYGAAVIDPTKPGILIVEAFDVAGNSTKITTTYTPDVADLEPPQQNLGAWAVGNPPNIAYDTLYNVLKDTIHIGPLHLLYGNVGFSIFDSVGGPVDTSPLAPGERRLIQIQFEALNSATAVDSIVFVTSIGCGVETAAVIGGGTGPNFTVTSQTWPNELLPAPSGGYIMAVTISNFSSITITIDSVWWADTVHFKPVSTLPFTFSPSPGSTGFSIAYFPDSNSLFKHDRTEASWFSPQILETDGTTLSPRFDSLIGWALPPLSVEENNPPLGASVITLNDGRALEIILPADMPSPANFELVNVLGQSVLRTTLSGGNPTIDASGLPRGVYFYHMTMGSKNQSGKLLLGQ